MQGKISYCPEPIQNKPQKWPLRQSLQSTKMAYRKLMIYQVITSQSSMLGTMSPQANYLTKRALGVNVCALKINQNSNLRAFAFVIIKTIYSHQFAPSVGQQVINILKQLQLSPPVINNYNLSNKFTIQEMLQIFAAMLYKVGDLIEGSLTINQIIQVYPNYLDLVVFFLRCLLTNMNLQKSSNHLEKLSTIQTYSILSEYFDITYIVNNKIYLFPDLKTFVASPDDQEFVFGKFYDNVEELNKHQSQIRDSTIKHIQQENLNYQNRNMQQLNLEVSISQIFTPQKMNQIIGGNFSKAPTPQFGQSEIQGFSQPLENPLQIINKKHTILNMDQIRSQYDHNINPQKDYFLPQRQSTLYESLSFQRKILRNTQSVRPTIHQDMFLNYMGLGYPTQSQKNKFQNPQHKITRQNNSMKGVSMMEQQISSFQFKQKTKDKQMDHKSVSRQRMRQRRNRDDNNSVNTLNPCQNRSRAVSPNNSQNAKSEHFMDFRSDTSQNTKKTSMKINSEVYNINIQGEHKNNRAKNNIEINEYKKINENVKQLINSVKFINPDLSKSKKKKESIKANKMISFQEAKQYNKKKNEIYNHNHNHIHIHIHNQGEASNTVRNKKIKQQINKQKQNNYQSTFEQQKNKMRQRKNTHNAKITQAFVANVPTSVKNVYNKLQNGQQIKNMTTTNSKNNVRHYPFTQSEKTFYNTIDSHGRNISFQSDMNPINLSFNHNRLIPQTKKVYEPPRRSHNVNQKISERASREHSADAGSANKLSNRGGIPHIPSFLKNKSKNKLIGDKDAQQGRQGRQGRQGSQNDVSNSKKDKRTPNLQIKTKLQEMRKLNGEKYDLKSATSLKKIQIKQSMQLITPTFRLAQHNKK